MLTLIQPSEVTTFVAELGVVFLLFFLGLEFSLDRLREPEPISGAQPSHVIEQGDTLVTVGRRGQYGEFRRLLAAGPIPAPSS